LKTEKKMKIYAFLVFTIIGCAFSYQDIDKSPFDIVISPTSSATEIYAANTLKSVLETYVCEGYTFPVVNASTRSKISILSSSKNVGEEGFEMVLESNDAYVISGSVSSFSRRGTVYGVIEALQRLGVKFLTSKVTVSTLPCPWNNNNISNSSTFSMLPSHYSFTPLYEERDVGAFDVDNSGPDFAIRRRLNHGPAIPSDMGGGPIYASPPGFVHTSYNLVNKTMLYNTHNEWFWPRDDITVYGQLWYVFFFFLNRLNLRSLER
jgi:hypothetical protein